MEGTDEDQLGYSSKSGKWQFSLTYYWRSKDGGIQIDLEMIV